MEQLKIDIKQPETKTLNNITFNIVKENLSNFVYNRLLNLRVTNYKSGDTAIATSLIGTPVYSNLLFQSGSTTDPATGQKTNFPQLRIDSAVMQVDGGKHIVKTTIQGRDGTVKEFIANNDYQVSIAGYLISSVPNLTPIEEKNSLISICNAKTSIGVASSFLNDFGIYNIVIDNFKFEEREGFRNIIPFSITASSDLPYDLEIEQETA